MGKKLGDYLTLLRSNQQEFIVLCVQKYSDRPDFHRGLLPFLEAEEAARCLQFHLEGIKQRQSTADPDEAARHVLGEKYIRQIISVFRGALIYRLNEDEASEVIYLNSVKLKRLYGKRFGKKFHVSLTELGVNQKRPIDGMYELQFVSRNQWKVTGHKEWLSGVTDHLSQLCGY